MIKYNRSVVICSQDDDWVCIQEVFLSTLPESVSFKVLSVCFHFKVTNDKAYTVYNRGHWRRGGGQSSVNKSRSVIYSQSMQERLPDQEQLLNKGSSYNKKKATKRK